MKYVWASLRVLAPLGAIVFAVLSMNAEGDARAALLGACVGFLMVSTIMNMRDRRKTEEAEKAAQAQQEAAAEEPAAEAGEDGE